MGRKLLLRLFTFVLIHQATKAANWYVATPNSWNKGAGNYSGFPMIPDT